MKWKMYLGTLTAMSEIQVNKKKEDFFALGEYHTKIIPSRSFVPFLLTHTQDSILSGHFHKNSYILFTTHTHTRTEQINEIQTLHLKEDTQRRVSKHKHRKKKKEKKNILKRKGLAQV